MIALLNSMFVFRKGKVLGVKNKDEEKFVYEFAEFEGCGNLEGSEGC